MANEQNLKPFKKGLSGNPAGRPKKLPQLDTLLADVLAEERKGITVATAILQVWVKLALKGNLKAGEMLFNRAYGQPKAPVEVNNFTTLQDGEFTPEQINKLVKIINQNPEEGRSGFV